MQFQEGSVPGVQPQQPPQAASPSGGGAGGQNVPLQAFQEWDLPPRRGRPSPWLIVLAIGGLGLGGFGLVKSLMEDPKPRVVQLTTPSQPSFFSEQQQMMREALDMAKEAQAMQRERMQMFEQQMEAAYEGEMAPLTAEDDGG